MISTAILSGFVLALLAPFLTRRLGAWAGWGLAVLPAALTIYLLGWLSALAAGDTISEVIDWAPALGLTLAFRADGLSLLFALLITGVGTVVFIYAGGYLKGHVALGRLYAWLSVFMASMLGVALADNLILLFVFWELTGISSFMLIGFNHDQPKARTAAQQALIVTGGGGLALLAGLLLLGQAGQSMSLSQLLTQGDVVQAHPLFMPALLLILIGAFTKSAQFPFHFWLPEAMEAPAPVSAYLHSATMVKAGIYLLARLAPALGGHLAWTLTVTGVGAITMIVGGLLALGQTDMKRLLAYSTISALGTLVMLTGLGTPLALKAMLVFLLTHALYKGALFLVAGAVDHETGSRDVTKLGRLSRAMPVTGLAAGLAALSMAGLPPLVGFIAKELIYEVALQFGVWLTGVFFVGMALNVFVAGTIGMGPFWGPAPAQPVGANNKPVHEAPISMWLGTVSLAGLGLLIGIWPGLIDGRLIGPAASAVMGKTTEVHLYLWHGINTAFLLSLATIVVGALTYWLRDRVRGAATRWPSRWGPAGLYQLGMETLLRGAAWHTRYLQSGYLRYYLIIVIMTTAGIVSITQLARGGFHWPDSLFNVRFYELALAALIVLASIRAVTSPSRLGAVAALGVAGYAVAILFLLFGAPDLAMTQFLIESLTVILFVLVFYRLPRFAQFSPPAARSRDIVISLLGGGMMTLLVLSVVGLQLQPSISDYFANYSLPLAHGRNIVNVILVDFRGLDTMGEITVLGIAAIGVFALLKLNPKPKEDRS